jgi:hypothetical protein
MRIAIVGVGAIIGSRGCAARVGPPPGDSLCAPTIQPYSHYRPGRHDPAVPLMVLPSQLRAPAQCSGEDVFEAQAQEGQNHIRIEP